MTAVFRKSKVFQIGTLYRSFDFVRDWSVAVDVGASSGDWTEVMAWRFDEVRAFEPGNDAFAVLQAYLGQLKHVVLHNAAAWDTATTVRTVDHPDQPGKSRAQHVEEGGSVTAIPIDALNLTGCGLLKIDVEGMEMRVLRGARETIAKYHPVVIVECDYLCERFGFGQDEPGTFLVTLGARELMRRGIDRVYGWV